MIQIKAAVSGKFLEIVYTSEIVGEVVIKKIFYAKVFQQNVGRFWAHNKTTKHYFSSKLGYRIVFAANENECISGRWVFSTFGNAWLTLQPTRKNLS